MQKKILLRSLLWLLSLLWMGLIFFLSAETAAESSETSGSLLWSILAFFDRGFERYPDAVQLALVEQYSFLIRKTAHFSIYAILGFLLSGAFAYERYAFGHPTRGMCVLLPALIGGLYAVSDELHQYFVPGRSCELRDVLIDTAGVLLGIALLHLLRCLIDRGKNKEISL